MSATQIDVDFDRTAGNVGPVWMTITQSLSVLWSLFLAFLDYFSRPYRLASWKQQEKDPRIWLRTDEFARSTCIISSRVARLEEEFGILSSTCTATARTPLQDPSAERIKALEADLAETKKVPTLHITYFFSYYYISMTIVLSV